jgi:hypothetical protein
VTRRNLRVAAAVFVLVWVPATLWRGIEVGRTFRIGGQGERSVTPLVEGVIQMAFVMLAPSLLVGLLVLALLNWRAERRIGH